jgi:hypothetical protein
LYNSTKSEFFLVLYYCVPDFTSIADSALKTAFQQFGASKVGSYFSTIVGDLMSGLYLIIGSFFIAIFLAFFFIFLCHRFAKFLTWLMIAVIEGAMVIFALYLISFKADLSFMDSEENQLFEKSLHYLGYFVIVLAELLLIFIVMLRKRIEIAVQIVREASKAISDIPSLFIVPVILFVIAGGFTILWIYIAVNIFSVTVSVTKDVPSYIAPFLGYTKYQEYDFDQNLRKALVFHFFHYLWFIQFLKYLGYIIISGAIADWYFTRCDENGKKIRGDNDDELEKYPVLSSCWRALRYNLGTVAFASLILAFIQLARAVVAYLEKNVIAEGNGIQKVLFAAVDCILRMLECCLDKMSKHALIYCSIYGNNLCVSGYRSWKVWWKNLFRVAAITMVSEFLLLLGKLSVAFGTTAIAVLMYANVPEFNENMSSWLLPGAVIFIMAFVVSSIILLMYESVIDCVFFCFIVDYENNKGQGMFASEDIINLVDDNADVSKKAAMKRVRWKQEYAANEPLKVKKDRRASQYNSGKKKRNDDIPSPSSGGDVDSAV